MPAVSGKFELPVEDVEYPCDGYLDEPDEELVPVEVLGYGDDGSVLVMNPRDPADSESNGWVSSGRIHPGTL